MIVSKVKMRALKFHQHHLDQPFKMNFQNLSFMRPSRNPISKSLQILLIREAKASKNNTKLKWQSNRINYKKMEGIKYYKIKNRLRMDK